MHWLHRVGMLTREETEQELADLLKAMNVAEVALLYRAVQAARLMWIEEVERLHDTRVHQNGTVVTADDLHWLGYTTDAYDRGLTLLTLLMNKVPLD